MREQQATCRLPVPPFYPDGSERPETAADRCGLELPCPYHDAARILDEGRRDDADADPSPWMVLAWVLVFGGIFAAVVLL